MSSTLYFDIDRHLRDLDDERPLCPEFAKAYKAKVYKAIAEQIEIDFKSLGDWFAQIYGDVPLTKMVASVRGEVVTFSDTDLLLAAIVDTINGFGMTPYESVADFKRESCWEDGAVGKEILLAHLYWLDRISTVYGETPFTSIDTQRIFEQTSCYLDPDPQNSDSGIS